MNHGIPGRMACILLLCLTLCAPAMNARANGGPIDGSAVKQTGAIRLVNAPDINLLAEDLSVTFEGDLAHVEVRYALRNQGPAATVEFGFPVYVSEYIRSEVEQSPSLVSFALLDNGQELAWQEAARYEDAPPAQCLLDLADERYEILGNAELTDQELQWFTSSLDFPGGEDKELVVRYTVRVQFLDAVFSKSFLPSYSMRLFLYDFSPAAGWGDGRMGSLDISVDFSHNRDLGMEFLALSPGEFRDQGDGVYTLHMEDVDAANLCSMVLAYDPADWLSTEYVLANRVAPEHLIITASSSQEGYPVENLLDNDPATAWVPEGDGVGAWLKVQVQDETVAGVLLINGYTKSPALYLANSRARTMDVAMAATYWDDRIHERTDSRDLPDLPFDLFRPENFFSFAQVVVDIGDGYLAAPGMTLTVTSVYPGTQYHDLCFSELYVVGMPDY